MTCSLPYTLSLAYSSNRPYPRSWHLSARTADSTDSPDSLLPTLYRARQDKKERRAKNMSRFAGLKIEDDSEEDEFTAIVKGAAKKGKKPVGGPAPASKSKAKNKHPRKKNASEATTAEWEALDAKLARSQFKSDLEAAISASKISATEEAMIKSALQQTEAADAAAVASPPAAAKKKGKKKKAVSGGMDGAATGAAGDGGGESLDDLASQTAAEVARILKAESRREGSGGGSGGVESVLVSVYRSKLETASDELTAMRAELAEKTEEGRKYKDRYKKLCELLKDVEVKEKAQLLVELDRSAKVREEMAEEISALSGELAQAKSRIHSLLGHAAGHDAPQ